MWRAIVRSGVIATCSGCRTRKLGLTEGLALLILHGILEKLCTDHVTGHRRQTERTLFSMVALQFWLLPVLLQPKPSQHHDKMQTESTSGRLAP